jgi:hypothetical protein
MQGSIVGIMNLWTSGPDMCNASLATPHWYEYPLGTEASIQVSAQNPMHSNPTRIDPRHIRIIEVKST